MVRDILDGAPPGLKYLLIALDPLDDGRKVEIAADLWPPKHFGQDHDDETLRSCDAFIDWVLANPDYTRSDLKRLLKKAGGPVWGMQYEFHKNERGFLEALREAIRIKLQSK